MFWVLGLGPFYIFKTIANRPICSCSLLGVSFLSLKRYTRRKLYIRRKRRWILLRRPTSRMRVRIGLSWRRVRRYGSRLYCTRKGRKIPIKLTRGTVRVYRRKRWRRLIYRRRRGRYRRRRYKKRFLRKRRARRRRRRRSRLRRRRRRRRRRQRKRRRKRRRRHRRRRRRRRIRRGRCVLRFRYGRRWRKVYKKRRGLSIKVGRRWRPFR